MAAGLPAPRDGAKRSAADLLSLESVGFTDIQSLWPELAAIPDYLHAQPRLIAVMLVMLAVSNLISTHCAVMRRC